MDFVKFIGHHKPGESDLDTAWREMYEQCGFGIDDLKLYEDDAAKFHTIWKVHGGLNTKRVSYWLAELVNPRTKDVKLGRS